MIDSFCESTFFRQIQTGLVKCQILVPDYRLKDTRALFSRDLNLSINAYILWKRLQMTIGVIQKKSFIFYQEGLIFLTL